MTGLADEIVEKIRSRSEQVVTRDQIDVAARYDSVSRALGKLVREDRLVRVAPGKYALADARGTRKVRTPEELIAERIRKSPRNVFLRDDFSKYGTYDRVGRALQRLTRSGKLVQVGYGLYARGQISPFTGKPAPAVGIGRIAREALQRLGKSVDASSWEKAYNSGRSTQVPTGRTVAVKGRIRRKIGYDGNMVKFERA